MDLKSKVGPITAVVVATAAVTWMAVGGNGITVSPTGTAPNENTVSSQTAENQLTYSVQAQTLTAKSIEMHLTLSGKTQVDETLQLINSYQGRITRLPIEKGQFVKKGSTIAQIDNRTLKVQIEQAGLLVKQRQLELEGIKKLNAQNLTSKVNLAQAETDLASARATEKKAAVDFVLDEQKAHAFSAALLTLDDTGRTAIKAIDIDNRVVILPVDIVKSERDQVWVRGLPDNVNIITVGQGFVSAGDKVDAHYQN